MSYRIGQVAEKSGIGEYTLRYYEKEGLIEVPRDASGVRQYAEEDLNWLQLIKCLRETGMSIADIREIARLNALGEASIAERKKILKRHRRHVEEKIEELQRVIRKIDCKISFYDNAKKGGGCCGD